MIIHLIVALIKKTLYKMSRCFPEPCRTFRRDINGKVDLSNYAAKSDLKSATGVDTSKLAAKSESDKLKGVPIDLSKLSNIVNNVVKKIVYDKLVGKVNNIDTTGFVLKTKYDTDKSDLENKISDADKKPPDTSGLVKKNRL